MDISLETNSDETDNRERRDDKHHIRTVVLFEIRQRAL